MRTDALVGRRLSIDALHSAVDGALAGAGGVVLLSGEPGMGKTVLAAEAAAYAKARGATAVWGTCWEGAGAPGYWPWVQVVRALPDGGAVLAELTGTHDAVAGVLGDEAAVRFRGYDATAMYIRAQAARQPLVLVLDDLHWADLSSLRLLAFLARQLRDAAVLVIGTYRDVEVASGEHPAGPLLAELAGQAEPIRLTGLTCAEVGELLDRVCGARLPAALAAVVHERTGGNPFFVQQTGRLLAGRGLPPDGPAAASGVPPAVGDVLARRLARLPSDVADLLGVAAVVGKRFAVAVVAALAGRPVPEVVAGVDAAVRAGIVEDDGPGGARFGHDLFREVLYTGLPAARRSALHLALAELLERDGDLAGGAAQIAHHRTMALPLGDRGRALSALLGAAREATARTAFDEATAQLGRAVDVAGGPEAVQPGILCDYADAQRRAGNTEAARAAFRAAARRARAAGDAGLLARAAFGTHRVATPTDSSRSGVIALLTEGLAALGEEPPGTTAPGTRWLLTAALARELADGPDSDRPRAAALAAAAVDGARSDCARSGRARTGSARPAAAHAALAYALFALCDVRWEPGSAAERLPIADQLAAAAAAAGETELLLEAHLSRLVALLELGDPAFAAQLDAFGRLAEDAAIPRYLYLARSRQATLASLTGPFTLADELIEAAADYGARVGEPDTWAVQASQLAGLAFLRKDWTRVSAFAAARGKPLTPPEFAPVEQAWLLVEAGQRAAAALLVAGLPERPAAYRWRHAALLAGEAELAAAVGDRRRCAALYDQLLPIADEFAVVGAAVFSTGPVALQLGLLAAALGRPDDAAGHLADAAVRCDRLGARLHGDRARAELARVRAAASGAVRAGDDSPDGAAPPAGGELSPSDAPAEFRREGDVWTLAFGGRRIRIRDAKGLRDLAVLLAVPGREVAATDLVTGAARAATVPGGGAVPAGHATFGADPVLDERARAAYRARLAELDDALTAADARQDVRHSAVLAAERDVLIGELARAAGLGGRPRRLGDGAERARSTVTARIRDAIGRVSRAHPELGDHLRASVSTGAHCCYRPARTVRWHVSQS